MNSLSRFILTGAVFLAASQSSWAVLPRGQSMPPAVNTSVVIPIERGGTVNAIDPAKRVITVDGKDYVFLPASVKVNAPVGTSKQKAFQLKAGILIRFSTFKNFSSGQEEVREVWVSSEGSASPVK